MPRRYSVDGRVANIVGDTILGLTSAATIRPEVYDLILGSAATPADNAAEYVLQRYSATGSGGSAVTPRPLDLADPASLAVAHEAHTSEPTYTADLIMLAFATNQRATFRWVAAPGGEIVLPATANAGVGLQTTVTGGSSVITSVMMHFNE